MKKNTVAGLALLSILLISCGGGSESDNGEDATTPDDVEVIGSFDASSAFDAGTIALSMSPEDNRLSWLKDQSSNSWDFYGTRDANGEAASVEKIEVESTNAKMTFFYDLEQKLVRIESTNQTSGESTALQFTYLANDQMRIDGYDDISKDLVDIDATGTISIASSSNSSQKASSNTAYGYLNSGNTSKKLSKVISEPITEIKSSFRTTVKTKIGELVNDATVVIDIIGPDRAPNVSASFKGNGIYESEVTLAKTAELSKVIDDCNKMVKIGRKVVDRSIYLVGLVGGAASGGAGGAGLGVLIADMITRALDIAGETIETAVLMKFVSEAFDRGNCAGVIDYIANIAGGNFSVNARVLKVESRPDMKPVTGTAATVPVEQIISGKTLWSVPDIELPSIEEDSDPYLLLANTWAATFERGSVKCDSTLEFSSLPVPEDVDPYTSGYGSFWNGAQDCGDDDFYESSGGSGEWKIEDGNLIMDFPNRYFGPVTTGTSKIELSSFDSGFTLTLVRNSD